MKTMTPSERAAHARIGYGEIQGEYLPGVPIGTLRAFQSAGKMPPSIVVGRRRLWKRGEIEQWVASLGEVA